MKRWFRQLLRRGPGQAPAPPAEPPVTAPPSAAIEELARPAVERFVEDESLRGDLTDASFGPVVAWISDLLLAAAGRAAGRPDSGDVMEQCASQARALGRSIGASAATGDLAEVREALEPPLLTPDETRRAADALSRLRLTAADPDERARTIVATLAALVPGRNA